jgi:hypothetical protein
VRRLVILVREAFYFSHWFRLCLAYGTIMTDANQMTCKEYFYSYKAKYYISMINLPDLLSPFDANCWLMYRFFSMALSYVSVGDFQNNGITLNQKL